MENRTPAVEITESSEGTWPTKTAALHLGDALSCANLSARLLSSQSSDTSSAYSGSDALPSSVEDPDIDNIAAFDSDNEEISSESFGSLIVRDKVREYLEKDPAYRSDDDISVLLEFMQHMPAFSNMTSSMRRELCAVMVFAVVEKAETVILSDGELLDTWSVVLNGHVEVSKPDGTFEHLHMGDSFGVTPTLEPQFHCGTMRTKTDDCQFVCVAHNAYHQIFHKGEESMVRVEENGEVVLVMEKKKLEDGHMGQILLRASPEKLLQHLIDDDHDADRTFVEDFLLTYRTFLRSPSELTDRLVNWFHDPVLREKAVKIVLAWTTNHFLDFDTDSALSDFLEKFEVLLEAHKLNDHLVRLHSVYSAKSHPRCIVLSRVNRDNPLGFAIIGGTERNSGVFISKVEKGSKAGEAGLKRGDQIIETNNCNFEHISCERASEILCATTHLAITVKSNLHLCRQLLQSPDGSPLHSKSSASSEHRSKCVSSDPGSHTPASGSPSRAFHHSSSGSRVKEKVSSSSSSPAQLSKLRKAFFRLTQIQRADSSDLPLSHELPFSHPCSRKGSSLSDNSGLVHPLSSSDPDLASSIQCLERHADYPEHVIRVYRSDQSFRYLPIHKETTAREVVMLALTEFGISDPSCNFSLCEVTFEECGTRTKHLPDQLSDLADRCRLNARYYLKNIKSIETLVPDELTSGILRECHISLLQLLPAEVAIQLTLRDFRLFQSIPPTEYINDLFELKTRAGCPNLCQFSGLVNQEMFWVVTEVCSEQNLIKRAKVIKQFIKIAKYCRMARNFNSFFAILSGLGHGSVSRLHQSWEKLSTKYVKLFEEMQDAMDPSRNMSKYRNMLSAHLAHPPVIPFFPLVKKDLTFIHFGNDSRVDGLVNFDKLRMIAKEIRQVNRLASSDKSGKSWPYENILPNFSCLAAPMHGTIRQRRTVASNILSPKKMYDEALMARRVRTYLINLKIVEDETKLAQMSSSCESPGQLHQRRADPNVSTPSFISDFSTATNFQVTAFGSSSPSSVRKMLSLSDHSRPVDPKKHRTLHFDPSCVPVVDRNSHLADVSCRALDFRRVKKRLPLLAVVNLSEESSSVSGVGRQFSCEQQLQSMPSMDKPDQITLIENTLCHMDSDSGHSSVGSSVLDGLSPSVSELEQGPGILVDVLPEFASRTELVSRTLAPEHPAILSSSGCPVICQALTSPNSSSTQRHRRNGENLRGSRYACSRDMATCSSCRNSLEALRHLEEPRKRRDRVNFNHRRTLSCSGAENADIISEFTWNEVSYDDLSDDAEEELVSIV